MPWRRRRRRSYVILPCVIRVGDCVQVHPVDALQFERHVLVQDFGYALWYAHFRLRYDSGSSGPTATSVAISLARTAFSSSPSTGAISPDYQLLLKRTRYISSV